MEDVLHRVLTFDEPLRKPIPPAKLGITEFTKVTRDNYAHLSSIYQVSNVLPPPAATRTISDFVANGDAYKLIPIPENYQAATALLNAAFNADSEILIEGLIGTKKFEVNSSSVEPSNPTLNNEINSIVLAVTSTISLASPPFQVDDYILTVDISCDLVEEVYVSWQIKMYNEILAGYEKLKDEYYENAPSGQGNEEGSNPDLNRQIEQTNLKYGCENLLLNIYYELVGFPANDPVQIDIDTNESLYKQFFNQALEWDEMTYAFSEHSSSARNLDRTFAQGGEDSLQPFLQAQTANVLIPVRPSFNLKLLYFLTTGLIWKGKTPFVPILNSDLLIAFALKELHHSSIQPAENAWDVLVPTSMQIIQESDELPIIHNK